MKRFNLISFLCALCASAFIGSGCQNLDDPNQMAAYLAEARDIFDEGTTALLLTNPNSREDLVKVRDELEKLSALPDGAGNETDLVSILNKLPLDQMTSKKGQIYVLAGRATIRRFIRYAGDPKLDIGHTGKIKQFALAMRDGMSSALRDRPAP